jgi:hypothetical protein
MRFARVLLLLSLLIVTTAPLLAQTYTTGDILTVIQRPLLNIPSIVRPGDDLEISCVADPSTTGWTATLERGGLNVPLTISASTYDATTTWWTVTATMPEMPVHELYDLHVTANGGIDDTTQDAVRVIPAYRDDFYFVHITDTHLPTYLYYYQDGADTDSTTSEGLREITLDVNIINPEFVLLTGDMIHEGELEDYLDKKYYSRSQMHLGEFEVPVYLTAGNHDIGGWDSTPPSDGTARRDWWRFYGWERLDAPPAGAPWYTQNYSFDYGPVHFIGIEAYDNYDSWRYSTYGAESYTSGQMTWLSQDIAAAGATYNVLFHHYDFDNELNLGSLGIDMSLWGHIHRDEDDYSHPFDIATDNASGSNRPFRLIRFVGGVFNPRPTLDAYDGGELYATYAPANDGTHDTVTAQVVNSYNERFEFGRLKINMPAGAAGYMVTGGTLAQVDDTGPHTVCYVDVDIPANGYQTVVVEVDEAASTPPALSGSRLSAHPNPFNPRTEIAFTMPGDGFCRLTVFDAMGREVKVLADEYLLDGEHSTLWDGRDAHGETVPSGVYLLGLRTGVYSESRKITLSR